MKLTHVALFALLITVYLFTLTSASDDREPERPTTPPKIEITEKKYAYATIHYEGTPDDEEYILGLRVMIQSLKLSKTEHDIIVLVSSNVSPRTRMLLKEDGAILIPIPDIKNPFIMQQQRFIHTLNKLHLWNLTKYERIIYLDSDTIALHKNGKLDELFICGHFCVVYQNPCNFHTGLFVVKPDEHLYNKLMKALEDRSLPSYDGADQGFLTAFFKYDSMAASPLFDYLNGEEQSDAPMMRLAPGYNLNAFWFYEKGHYGLYRCHHRFLHLDVPGLSLTFPVPHFLKPWFWWPYLFLDVNWYEWQEIRLSLNNESWFGFYSVVNIGLFFVSIFFLYTFWTLPNWLLNVYQKLQKLYRNEKIGNTGLGLLFGFVSLLLSCLIPFLGIIPYTAPPHIAFPLFCQIQLVISFFCIVFAIQSTTIIFNNQHSVKGITNQFRQQPFSFVIVVLKYLLPTIVLYSVLWIVLKFGIYYVASFNLGKILEVVQLLTCLVVMYLMSFRRIFVQFNPHAPTIPTSLS